MPDELPRLIKTFEFIERALPQFSGSELVDLISRRDRVFERIVAYKTDDGPSVLAQTRFLASCLADAKMVKGDRASVVERCRANLKGLLAALELPVHAIDADATAFRYFDSVADRVSVFDSNYHYVFCNKANAAFHGKDAAWFSGKPSWAVIGEKPFSHQSKSLHDACLAGRDLGRFTVRQLIDPNRIFSMTMQPIRGEGGRISGIVATARDVSMLNIPVEFDFPAPWEA